MPPSYLPSFGRRQGRTLRPHQKRLVAELLPNISVILRDTSKDLLPPEILAYAQDDKKIHLEIGFGAGEHLAARALAHPDILFIGCEPYINGVASLLAVIEKENIQNIRLFTDDARELIAALPEASVEQVYILFPDPWPKARHQKRRIVNRQTLDALARIQPMGGKLLLATDHEDYGAWMLEHVLAHPHYRWTAESPIDWENPPPGWVETRYQRKTMAEGRQPLFIDCVRTG